MELYWLRLVKSCVLELRPLKDYAGQDLIFNPQAYMRRCVLRETLDHELIKRYIGMRMIEMEKPMKLPPAAPSVVDTAPAVPAPAAAPVVAKVLVPEAAPEVAVVAEPEVPEALPEVAELEAPADAETEALAPASEASVSESSPELTSSDEELTKPSVESYKKKRR